MKAKIPEQRARAMLKVFLDAKRWVLIAAVCTSTCAMSGCIESSFNLAYESRLPQGITVPPGLTREDVTVTMDFIGIRGARLTIRDKTGKKLATVYGKVSRYPVVLNPPTTEQGYELVVIDGVLEIMECVGYRENANMVQNGRTVALFYVIDDPAVRKAVLDRQRSVGK
jgi:hypothetical protein